MQIPITLSHQQINWNMLKIMQQPIYTYLLRLQSDHGFLLKKHYRMSHRLSCYGYLCNYRQWMLIQIAQKHLQMKHYQLHIGQFIWKKIICILVGTKIVNLTNRILKFPLKITGRSKKPIKKWKSLGIRFPWQHYIFTYFLNAVWT